MSTQLGMITLNCTLNPERLIKRETQKCRSKEEEEETRREKKTHVQKREKNTENWFWLFLRTDVCQKKTGEN